MSYRIQGRANIDAHLRHFDALYAVNGDPWRASSSPDEARKRRIVGYALGTQSLGHGLELGCGNGIATRALARRFLRLLAVDGSVEAVTRARQAAPFKHVKVIQSVLPCALPQGRYQAIVASEILYYLPRRTLGAMLKIVHAALCQGGLFVSTHHLRQFEDAECDHATLVRKSRAVFGREQRQLHGFGWRCYLHVKQ